MRFGESIDIIMDRKLCEKTSCLAQFDVACEMFKKYYQYEIIDGMLGKRDECSDGIITVAELTERLIRKSAKFQYKIHGKV